MERRQLREAIEIGIPLALKYDGVRLKRHGSFLPAYTGGVIVALAFALFPLITTGGAAGLSILEIIVGCLMGIVGSLFFGLIFAIIPIVKDLLAGLGSLVLTKRHRALEQEMNQIRIQFEKQTNLNAYFCDSYTLGRFHHYLEVGIADSLKECEKILQQENLRDEISSLRGEVAGMRDDLDRDLDDIRRELRD